MPSWDIHVRVARLLGLDPYTAREVNVDVDVGPLHDIGRKLPRRGFGGWSVQKALVREKQLSHLLRVKSKIEGNKAYRHAFVLHHVIDVLADLMVSRRLLEDAGIVVGIGVLRKRVRIELQPLETLVARGDIEKVVDRVFGRIGDVEETVDPWVTRLVEERRRYAMIGDEAYVNNMIILLATSHKRWADGLVEGIIRSLHQSDTRIKIELGDEASDSEEKPDCDYLMGNLLYRLNRRALLTSLYFDILYTCFKHNTEILHTIVVRTTKKKAAAMGREAVKACISSGDPHCALHTAIETFNIYTLKECKKYKRQARDLAAAYSEKLHTLLTRAAYTLKQRYGCKLTY